MKCSPPLLEARSVSKVYPGGIRALDRVDFDLCFGEIHALLGENGAGKSTLAKILYGLLYPDEGFVAYKGHRVSLGSPRDALRIGILYVPQYPLLPRGVSVREVVELYIEARGAGSVSDVVSAAEELGWSLELDRDAGGLTLVERQRLMLSIALGLGFEVLLLDEPTSFLSGVEVERLLSVVEKLRGSMGVVYVTHRIGEVRRLADRVTVLRSGRVVARLDDPRGVAEEELVKLVVGERVAALKGRKGKPGDKVVLRVEDLSVGRIVKNVSFVVRKGEVVAIVGIEGMGQKELLEAIVGLRRDRRGRVLFNGVEVHSVPIFRRMGGRYVPGDRLEALALELSVAENVVAARHVAALVSRLGVFDWRRVSLLVSKLLELFGVKGSPSSRISELSGGNQQRVLLAREMGVEGARLLVMHNPTAGLDAKGAHELLERIARMADEGVAVLFSTPSIDEALAVADRILVMRGGRLVAEFERGVAREEVAKAILA